MVENKKVRQIKHDPKELDHWYRNELPDLIINRPEPHITKDELIKIVERKLLLGKFRPGFINRVLKNSNETVVKCSKEAFEILDDSDINSIKAAIKKLQELFGIGLATTTTILCLVGDVPFFSDGIASIALKKHPKYQFKEYDAVYNYCLEKQKQVPDLKLTEIEDAISLTWAFEKESSRLQSYKQGKEITPRDKE